MLTEEKDYHIHSHTHKVIAQLVYVVHGRRACLRAFMYVCVHTQPIPPSQSSGSLSLSLGDIVPRGHGNFDFCYLRKLGRRGFGMQAETRP